MSPQDLRIAVHFLCGFGFVRLLSARGGTAKEVAGKDPIKTVL
jgi:hypothetical protein